MRKVYSVFTILPLAALFISSPVLAKEHLDLKNATLDVLMQKSWAALKDKNYHTAQTYAKTIVDRYADQAQAMEASLKAYPTDKKIIFQYWALNDVGAALFILGESYQNSGKKQEALKVFQEIIDKYRYAQCWDTRGWFWKPANVAQDKLNLAAQGIDVDFGNYNSNVLVQKAWAAAGHRKVKEVEVLVHKVEELYGPKAREMQNSLKGVTDAPLIYKQKVFDYWALNDVGTALFILADTYRKRGRRKEADELYWRIINEYSYAQCWQKHGEGFWKPADAAERRLRREKIKQSLFGD